MYNVIGIFFTTKYLISEATFPASFLSAMGSHLKVSAHLVEMLGHRRRPLEAAASGKPRASSMRASPSQRQLAEMEDL